MTKETIELNVEGLDCPDCASKVGEIIAKQRGIEDFRLFLSTQKAQITFDRNQITSKDIINRIRKLGYKVNLAGKERPLSSSRVAEITIFAFISVLAILVLAEILLERLEFLAMPFQVVPTPLLFGATIIGGYPIFRRAFFGLAAKEINADMLMTVAIIAAMTLREFVASLLIVFFMSIAHFLEGFTIEKSRQAIKELIEIAPKTARVVREDREVEISLNDLRIGEVVVVRPGEKVPADGVVISGSSSVNQAPITGESIPVEKKVGDKIFAGTLNQLGALQAKVTHIGADSTLGKIISLVEAAETGKAPVQKFADRYSSYYLPAILLVATATYIISRNPVYAIAVLVVACPCAVALATPLAVVASVGSSAKRGLLIKGGLYLESLAKVDTILVDKTGTLTLGHPKVTAILSCKGFSHEEVIRMAASTERYSEHPLASAILEEAARRGIDLLKPEKFKVLPGKGVAAKFDGKIVLLGNRKLMDERGVLFPRQMMEEAEKLEAEGRTILLLAVDSNPSGLIAVGDILRREVPEAIGELKRLGKRIVLLTGDNERIAASIARSLGITEYKAGLLPEDKIREVKKLQAQGRKVAMIGDGINDAPALAQADVGIAMGVAGTDIALEAAHVALMADDWSQMPKAIRIGNRAFATIKQNIVFGILFNIVGTILASVGILTPVLAAAAQSLPDVVVFLNSSKLLRG